MKTLLNIIWFLFGGLEMAIAYFIAGFLLLIPIVTIPWAIASFRIAGYALWPFGKEIVTRPTAGVGSGIGNVIWFVFAGWWLALGHIVSALLMAITIIGLPLAAASLKMIPLAVAPLGKEIVRR
jgi:uncharacterized membrane protein YccF (DUF307 family)